MEICAPEMRPQAVALSNRRKMQWQQGGNGGIAVLLPKGSNCQNEHVWVLPPDASLIG
jgi:hypothetical protein